MTVRIIAGSFRGRQIAMPPAATTRPTSDRLRGSVFDILAHRFAMDFAAMTALDVFAGSGAYGFEFLSRGGNAVVFFDKAHSACAAIKTSITRLGVGARATLLQQDATQPDANRSKSRADLVFLDPPWHRGLVAPALHALCAGGWLTDACLAVIELAGDEPTPDLPLWRVVDARAAGAAKLVFAARD